MFIRHCTVEQFVETVVNIRNTIVLFEDISLITNELNNTYESMHQQMFTYRYSASKLRYIEIH